MDRLRRNAALLPLLACAAGLTFFPAQCAEAVRDGLTLCVERVVPALFPFFVLSSLAVSCGAAERLGRPLAPAARTLFGVGGAGAGALALGLIGGYPVGAKSAQELYRRGAVGKEEAERLLTFCNNAGPGFLLGVCGGAVFHSARAGAWLYLIHAASALLTGALLCRKGSVSAPGRRALPVKRIPFSVAFPSAVSGAATSVLQVCAFVTLFYTALRLAAEVPAVNALLPEGSCARALVFGFVELTNGVTALPPDRGGFVCCAALLSWGGWSVHAQTLGVLAGSGLSARRYLAAKAVQALLSVPLAALAARFLF